MALFKSRPKILTRVPSEIRAGDEPVILVLLDCRREVEVEHVDVELIGRERWGTGDANESATLVHLAARLCGARTLARGRTELPVRMSIPVQAPPSFRGTAGVIEYELRAVASVPWWPNARAAFELRVVPPYEAPLADAPQVYSTDPEGPRDTEAHFELSLGSNWTRAGGIVEGAIALYNVAYAQYSEIQVGLRALERLFWRHGALHVEREAVVYQVRLGVAGAVEGEMIPFRFRVPESVEPEVPFTYRPDGEPPRIEVRWQLEVAVAGCTVRVPYRVLPRSSREGDAPVRMAPPTIGSDRLRALWESAGAAHGLRYQAQTLTGRVGETELVVRRDHRGRDGLFLVADLRYPDLGLDLRVEPAGLVDRIVGTDIPIGEPAWDRAYSVQARDRTQVQELLQAVAGGTRRAELRGMHDEGLSLAWRDAGQSQTRLSGFLASSVALATLIERSRARVPPPLAMRAALEGWQALAASLGGALEPGRMCVNASLAGAKVRVLTEYGKDGGPVGTWLEAAPSARLDEAQRWTFRASDGDEAIDARFKGEARELVRLLVRSASELRIEPDRVALHLAAPLGVERAGVLVPPEQASLRLERLARLGSLLRTQAGPYR